MTTNERPEQDGPAEKSVLETQALAVTVKEPLAPKGMKDGEAAEMKARAIEVARQLRDSTGSKEMEVVDSMTTLGMQAQRHAGGELDLLRTRVGKMLTQEGPSSRVTKDLVDLRMTLKEIDPHELSGGGVKGFISALPLGKRLNFLVTALEKISIRFETISKQVVAIESRLREGRLMLARDNIELRKLYEQVESQQMPIARNAYLGELLMQQLDALLREIEDARKKDRVQSALYDVTMRVQDLRTMQEVHEQLFASIEMTRQNNSRLGQAVERTLALATNMLMVGLAIQSALVRQKRVLEATKRTREFLGNLLVANAASIKQHTADIGDVYKSPVIAIDKITQAHNDLMEAMDMADRLKTEGITAARENIATLTQLSGELAERAAGLKEQREAKSLEA